MPLKKALLLSAAMPLFAVSLTGLAHAQGMSQDATVTAGPVLLAQADAPSDDSDDIRKKRRERERESKSKSRSQEQNSEQAKPRSNANEGDRDQAEHPSQKSRHGATSGQERESSEAPRKRRENADDRQDNARKAPASEETAKPMQKAAPEKADDNARDENRRRKSDHEGAQDRNRQKSDRERAQDHDRQKSDHAQDQERQRPSQSESDAAKDDQQERRRSRDRDQSEETKTPTPQLKSAPSDDENKSNADRRRHDEGNRPSDRANKSDEEKKTPADAAEKHDSSRERATEERKGKPLPDEPSKSAAAPAKAGEKPQTLQVPNGAPVLDSAKHGDHERLSHGNDNDHGDRDRRARDRNDHNDTERQAERNRHHGPVKIESVEKIHGERMQHAPDYRLPDDVKIRKRTDNRVILNIDNRTVIENHDHHRISHNARDVRYESLPHGNTREVVVRPNGVRVVTIRNEYGDILHRSRIGRNGDETVLIYAPDYDRGRHDFFRNPSVNLPPIRLTEPVDTYILDARQADEQEYITFLEKPPIEPVDQVYTLDQVRYSARLRDIMPRIDLDTITFDTGSFEIGQSQVDELQELAQALNAVLDRDPGQVFLIEGHTDAVGSDQSNLILSDQRAESVASALTQSFEVPPENLVTQGYGEQYLKVDTQGPERANRRVTVRRITPLIRPQTAQQ